MSNTNLPRVPVPAAKPGHAASGIRILLVVAIAVALGAVLHARAGGEPPDYPGALSELDAASTPLHATR